MNTQLTSDPTIRLLAEANPVPGTPTLSEAEAIRAEALLQRITAAPPKSDVARTARRDQKSRRRLGVRIGAAAAAVAAVVTAGMLTTTSASSAEKVLLETAAAAAQQPAVGPGQYWYTREELEDVGGVTAREVWLAPDSGVLREDSYTDDDGTVIDQDLSADGPPTYGDGVSLTWDELQALPTDATQLRRYLADRIHPSGYGAENDLWIQVISLLDTSPTPPEVRRALWEVVATIPGVELVGPTTDSVGRSGTAVERDESDRGLGHEVIVLNPTDGSMLEHLWLDADGNPLVRVTVLEEGVRDSAPAADPPLCGPGSVPERSC